MSTKLLQGDCRDLLGQIEAGSVDMVLCDLPYGTTRNAWDCPISLEFLWSEYARVTKPNAAIVLFAQTPFDKVLGASKLEWLRYEWIWEKTEPTGHLNAEKAPLKNHENILVFYRKPPHYEPQMRTGFKPYNCLSGHASTNYNPQVATRTVNDGNRYPVTVVGFLKDAEHFHPTQKPVALCEYLIRTYTKPGDLVLDNCAGSGSTLVAAKKLGRRAIGIEQKPEYVEIATKRLAQGVLFAAMNLNIEGDSRLFGSRKDAASVLVKEAFDA